MEEETNEELKNQVALLQQQLKSLMGSDEEIGILVSLGHGMTHRLATILSILVNRAPALISKSTLHQLLFGDRADGGPDLSIFNVYMTRMRGVLRRVKAQGRIKTVWNGGFMADPELVKWVKNLYEERREK